MTRVVLFALLVLTFCAGRAEATCSGGGLTWSCTAGSTAGQVQTAINSASDGATITLASGTYALTGGVNLDNRNGLTLICASAGACTITAGGDVIVIDNCLGANKTNLMRVSGFVFTGFPSTGTVWYWCPDFDVQQARIDHNTFTNCEGSQAIFFGETSSNNGEVFGVVDHNTFTGNNCMAFKNVAGGETWSTGRRGTSQCAFFEDNFLNFSANTNINLSGFDGYDASCTVLRFNTVRGQRLEEHSLCHPGMMNFETYGNDIENDVTGGQGANNYRALHSQGSGEWTTWGNRIKGGHMALQHYRSDNTQLSQGDCDPGEQCDGDWTASTGIPRGDGNRSGGVGYPCWHQPGRDAAATLKPVYQWKNVNESSALVTLSIESGSWTGSLANCANNDTNRINCHLVSNRDLYQAVSASAQSSSTSPFNGTVGVGFGTLANRPTTCTAGPGGADGTNGGVAYWATDQGGWNTSSTNPYGVQQSGADGVLYRCSTTNTWVTDYTPYCYPHPLNGGTDPCAGGGGGDPGPTPVIRLRKVVWSDLGLLVMAIVPVWLRKRKRRSE